MSSSPPPPSSTSSLSSHSLQEFNGYGARFVVILSVPLVLVALALFAVDSRSDAPWLIYFPSYGNGRRASPAAGDAAASVQGFSAQSPFSSVIPVNGASADELSFYGSPAPPPSLIGGGGGGGAGGDGVASDGIKEDRYPPPAAVTEPAGLPVENHNAEVSPSEAIIIRRRRRRRRRRDAKLEQLELRLSKARAAIKKAFKNSANKSLLLPDDDFVPHGPSYRNAHAFQRSYEEMEKLFKVYVYEEGELPLFHDGPCRSIYSSEGRFIHAMEMDIRFRTRDPSLAHVFFMPFSVVAMVQYIYKSNTYDLTPMKRTIVDYVNVISGKYPYWNRTLGADHLMLSCHDWGPYVSEAIPQLYNNSIRALCNANTSEGFRPAKDVSLLEINMRTDRVEDMMGGPSTSRRTILAFFAGGLHGPVRPLLLKAWKDKDPDMQVHEYLPDDVSYVDMMRRSKFCLCPSGHEVASPRIVEAIYLGCVPVTINDHYVLPFSDVLDWRAFSVQVAVEDIPNIKRILTAISMQQYKRMRRRVAMVQRHFVLNSPPRRFDVFHMILHSVWLRRLNVRVQDHLLE